MKRTKRLTALLCLILAAASVGTSSVFATDTDFEGVETGDAPDYEAAPEELVDGSGESEQNELIANEVGATLAGVMPSDLKISSAILTAEEYPDSLKDTLASDEKMAFYGAFDITLYDKSGAEWQPEEAKPILVSVDAALYGLKEGDNFVVMHYHDDGTPEAMGPFVVENGQANFYTTSFSSFAFVSGGTDENYFVMDPNISYGKYRTFYIHYGSSITLKLPSGVSAAWTVNPNNTTGLTLNSFGAGAYSQYSIGCSDGYKHGGKAVIIVNGCWVTLYALGNMMDPADTTYGSERIIYLKPGQNVYFPGRNHFYTTSKSTNYNMSNFNDWYVDGFLYGASSAGEWYNVTLTSGTNSNKVNYRLITVSANSASVAQASLTYETSKKITIRCYSTPQYGFPDVAVPTPDSYWNFYTFSHSYTNSYISPSICSLLTPGSFSSVSYRGVSDGTTKFEHVYDNLYYSDTGGSIKNYTSSINYDGFLSSLVGHGVYDQNGASVTASTVSDFSLLPYKIYYLADGPEAGWTIDCYLAPKRTLSYNVNVPGTPSPTITTPSSVTSTLEYGGSWETATVSTTPALNAQYAMTDGTTYKFLGWSTTAGGAVAYNPGASYGAVSSNTTLYGVWEQVILNFNLTVEVSGADMELDDEQCFVFLLQGRTEDDEAIELTFVVYGKGTTTIAELPPGNYAISGSDWAWRYGEWTWNDVDPNRSYNLGTLSQDTKITYTVSRTETQWLDANSYVSMPKE